MDFIFFLKPIVDMLYAYQILDIALLLVAIFCFSKGKIIRLHAMDFIVFFLLVMFTFSLLRNIEGFREYLKISSGFFLYYLGRMYYKYWPKYLFQLQRGFLIILVITMISYFIGSGFTQWGSVNTFTGYYFFKTDLAAAMAQCAVVFCLLPRLRKMDYLILAICSYFVVISNTRMYYFIIFILFFLIFYYQKYPNKRIRINGKFYIIIAASIIGLLIILNIIGQYVESLLLFKFENASDLMDGSNTQGRNQIWEGIYSYFAKQNFLTRLTGIDLISDGLHGGHDSHNVYLKILYSTGYLGIGLFLLFIFTGFYFINKVKSSRLFYVTSSLFGIFLLGGMSYSTILSTQVSWLPMFFIGVCISEYSHNYTPNEIALLRIYSSLTFFNPFWRKAFYRRKRVINSLLEKYNREKVK